MTGGGEGRNTGWWLAGCALAWLGGVACQLQQRALQAPEVYAGMALAGLLMLLAAGRWRRTGLAGLAGIALLGFALAGGRAVERLADGLPTALEGRDIEVVGVVAGLPQRSAAGLRFRFDVERATLDGVAVALPSVLSVGWYAGFHEDAVLTQPQQELGAGQRWLFTLRLRQAHGNLNPHGSDVELSMFEQGVRTTGYVRDGPLRLLDRAAGHWLERARQTVRDAIDLNVSDRRAAGVLAALSVGDQSAIEREDWDLFRNTGIAHLVSISGLHVTMFAWLAGLLIAAAWRHWPRAMLWLPAPLAARWGGLAAALAYALFSGWGVPSQRTVWMLATVTLLQAFGRRWPWPLVLLVSGVVVTAIDPWALTQPGFWLSFVAVGLLMASGVREAAPATSPTRNVTDADTAGDASGSEGATTPASKAGWRGWAGSVGNHLRGELRSQIIATVGLAPLTLVFFQQLSVVGLLANLVAIPLVTLVIAPLALLGAVAAPLWWLGAWLVRLLCTGLAWLAALPGAVWTVPAAPAWAQLAGIVAAVLLVLPVPWRLRALALPLALPLFMPPLDIPGPGRFELLAADVGQGSAVLVRTRAHLLVFDTGPQYARDSDAGQRVLMPLLRARGEQRIDTLVLSHRDMDHVGGARALLTGLPVGELSSSLEDGHALLALAAHATRCEAGQSWQWDGVHFDMLQPVAATYATAAKSNAKSCVLRVSGASGSALLPGDIERGQEAQLVASRGDSLHSDVLIAPHHGSRTSSTAAFLDAVQPRVVVFQAGYRNRFGHPAPDVVARYAAHGIRAVDSPSCGAWTWNGDAGDPGHCQRDVARHYWHHLPPPAAPP